MNRDFTIRALGEIAIRCANINRMLDFYEGILGLERLSGDHESGIVFLKLGESYGGHTAVLALFHPDAGRPELHPQSDMPPITGARSSLHHIALAVDYAEQDAIMAWYKAQGQDYQVQIFDWVGWRGIFTCDPEGNTVELVAYHPSLKQADAAI